jgi:hypothetical protein
MEIDLNRMKEHNLAEIESLIGQMPLEEKAALCTGASVIINKIVFWM